MFSSFRRDMLERIRKRWFYVSGLCISKQRFSNGDIDSQALALDRNRLNLANIAHLDSYIQYKLLLADLMRKTFYDFETGQPVIQDDL